jgi:DNA invertase Pin-like site-specific DNA recombinase
MSMAIQDYHRQGIDATTPAGTLQIQILGAIAEFERARIQERVEAR